VTRVQVSAACFDLLSQVVAVGGVLRRVCLFHLCGGVRFGALCTNAPSSYMT
jgi:hypothetical protein